MLARGTKIDLRSSAVDSRRCSSGARRSPGAERGVAYSQVEAQLVPAHVVPSAWNLTRTWARTSSRMAPCTTSQTPEPGEA